MISRPVQLRFSPSEQRPVSAWLLGGGSVERWLAEIGRWQMDESALKLYLVPEARDSLKPGDLFVMGSGLGELPVKPAALAYGLLGQGIYIPVESVLSPALSEMELRAMNRYSVLIFHPIVGPVGFDADAALKVADLLISIPRRVDVWDRMIPGIQTNQHIRSISFRSVPLFEEIFGGAADEIGTKPPEVLPFAKEPPLKNITDSVVKNVGGKFLGGLSGILRKVPHGGSQRTAFNAFEDWVNARLKGVLEDLERRRNKELHRLLEELSKNPDLGLRHAIPLSQVGLNRGNAPKSGQLGNHGSDFDLRRLGGGRAADYWNIPADLQRQLRTHYLALAERERQLGRHRRAAYIHAELLGDLSTAALILKEGRFFQEAAVLYRDHLHRPLEAAVCFVEARIISEAAAIYEKEQAWEVLGTLYEKLGEADKARNALRRWAESLIHKGDLLGAAEILRSRLDAVEEAVKLLKDSWPNHQQAARCLEKYFSWCAESLDHAAANAWLEEIDQIPISPGQQSILLRLYIHLQSHYPDRELRLTAEDFGRIRIAKGLPGRDEADRKQRIHMLSALASDDRLLRRDGLRYLDQNRAKPAPVKVLVPAPGKIPGKNHGPEVIHDFAFPQKGIRWTRVVGAGDRFFAIGQAQGSVGFVRSSFDGHHQMEKWLMQGVISDHEMKTLFCADSNSAHDAVYLRVLYRNEIQGKMLPATDVLGKPAFVGTPGWLTDDPLAAAFDPSGVFWLWRHIRTGLQLTSYQGLNQGVVRANLEIPFLEEEWVAQSIFGADLVPVLAVLEHRIVIGLGRKLHVLNLADPSQNGNGAGCLSFEENILAILPGLRWTKPHLAVVLEHQIWIVWLDGGEPRASHIQGGLENPHVAFTHGGTLVVMALDQGFLFNCNAHGVQASCQFERDRNALIAVIAGPEARSYTTVESNGNVKTFKFSNSQLGS